MSLFASAFGGAPAASSRPLGSTAGGKKRKRPSSGGKEDQLLATEANLAKLMVRVDAGLPDKGGKEKIGGGLSKKGKNKKEEEEEPAPQKKAKGRKEPKGKASKTKWAETDDASRSGANTVAVAPSARFAGAKAVRGKPEPFDLPMPAMPKAEKKDDGLTDMQRGMKTKLEGARFR